MRILTRLLMVTLLMVALTAPVLAAGQSAEAKPAAATAVSAKAELMDINSATDVQLKTLPGIGEAYAAKIIAGRPYTRKDQLKSKNIIPAATYDKIQDKIVATQKK
jgi:DNA uptake protein ComE-like DNA-binding protein